MEAYRCFQGNRLIALDGTEYFSSKEIHCQECCHRTHKNGTTTYFHAAITPVLVAPGKSEVINLEPEFISPQDGHDQQDCENAAAKRWIGRYKADTAEASTTLLGDHRAILDLSCAILDCQKNKRRCIYAWGWLRASTNHIINNPWLQNRKLTFRRCIYAWGWLQNPWLQNPKSYDLYCHQPICELAINQGFNFIFTCKPESDRSLYQWLDYLERTEDLQTLSLQMWDGRRQLCYNYRYTNNVPLRDAQPTLLINWCELTIVNPVDGTLIYQNSFATSHQIHDSTVAAVVSAGRARGKVENENNNVLKTKGYHLEHNFGHGSNHLAALMLCLNLLAFLFHTALDLTNITDQHVRKMLVTRETFFNDIRALTRYLLFEGWDRLFQFMLSEGNKPDFVNST